jgi:hypothetical protein
MALSNETYRIALRGRRSSEPYLRDGWGRYKVGSRGRTFRMSAERVLNPLQPAVGA